MNVSIKQAFQECLKGVTTMSTVVNRIGDCDNGDKKQECIDSIDDHIDDILENLFKVKKELKIMRNQFKNNEIDDKKIEDDKSMLKQQILHESNTVEVVPCGFLDHPCKRDIIISNDACSVQNISQIHRRTVMYNQEIAMGLSKFTLKINKGYDVGILFVPKKYNNPQQLKRSHVCKDDQTVVNYYDQDLYIEGKQYPNQGIGFNNGEKVVITVKMTKNGGQVTLTNKVNGDTKDFKIPYPSRMAFDLGNKNTKITCINTTKD